MVNHMTLKQTIGLAALALSTTAVNAAVLNIESASDWGGSASTFPASNAIDGSTAWADRWAAQGAPVNLVLDLGTEQSITDVAIAWGRGADFSYNFEIRARSEEGSDSWQKIYAGSSSGDSAGLESYNVSDVDARWIRVKVFDNSDGSDWNHIKEVQILGAALASNATDSDTSSSNSYDLDASQPPSVNFDLWDWSLNIPTDADYSGTDDIIYEYDLNDGYESEHFYTASDGGIVFTCPIAGYESLTGPGYNRTELREMLRRGDTSIETEQPENNWALSSIDSAAQDDFGGIDGTLSANLAVNYVTTTGEKDQVGRVSVGQIYADQAPLASLTYHLQPEQSHGAVYLSYQPALGYGDAQVFELIDGIPLNEPFSYQIEVKGSELAVTITADDDTTQTQSVDLASGGYDNPTLYFTAGVYNPNNTGEADDYVQATFYKLENSHENYAY